MPSKEAILENVSQYNADELVRYIKAGIVTFDELCKDTEGEFKAPVRKEVARKLEGSEEDDWNKAKDSGSIETLQKYLYAYSDSSHREEARNIINSLQKALEDAVSKDAWESVDKNNISSLRRFCEENPEDSHCKEAQKFINILRREEFLGFEIDTLAKKIKNIQADKEVINTYDEIYKTIVGYLDRGKIKHSDLMEMLKDDNNIFPSLVVNMLLENGYLDYDDFGKIGIEDIFVQNLVTGVPHAFATPRKLDKINKTSTEVYFWGIPSSGKSCALGAILSTANNGRIANSMKKDIDCQGIGYMTELSASFKTDGTVSCLPPGTPTTATYEMAFDLEDKNNKVHPITCIDLAGELLRCMYYADTNPEILKEDELDALDTLTKILSDNRTTNRKIHFFVLEYGAEDRMYKGLSQKDIIDHALLYVERTQVFKKDTDAIYLMITKVDKAHAERGCMSDVLRDYISRTYQGFYNGLVKICRDNEINNGKVEIIPFSLGRVCFQDYCLFEEKAAGHVVEKLLERSKGFKTDTFNNIINHFAQ